MNGNFELNLGALEDPELERLVLKHLQDEVVQEAIRAEEETLAASLERSSQTFRSIDGIGEQALSMSTSLFMHYKAIERFDFGSARDRKWLTSRCPEVRVKSGGTRIQSGYRCPEMMVSVERGNVRETVKYA